jgi:hypothetical protein
MVWSTCRRASRCAIHFAARNDNGPQKVFERFQYQQLDLRTRGDMDVPPLWSLGKVLARLGSGILSLTVRILSTAEQVEHAC